jgi:hypothetical protein
LADFIICTCEFAFRQAQLRLMRGKLVTKNSGATASYISGLAQVIVMIDEPRSLAKAKSALFRSIKPIK